MIGAVGDDVVVVDAVPAAGSVGGAATAVARF
jgi:hypothetical protein